MNLACLTHAYPRWEGDVAGAFIERLVLALTARGHGVHVVAPADAGKGGKELRHQVPVTRVRYAPARRETLAYRGTMVAAVRSPAGLLFAASLIQRQARVVARLCREEQLELVHAHWWIPGGVSAWLARRPYVVTLHGTDVALLEGSLPARLLARRVLRGAAVVTAVSSYLAERAARTAGLDLGSIVVQPMPADTRAFGRTSRGGAGVATVGRLTPQKRIPLLLEAWRPVRDQHGIELRLAGRRREDFPALPDEPGLRILGEVSDDDLAALYSQALAFVYPSLYEGFGLPVLEAMQCGACVITSTDPAIAEVIGDAGPRLDPRDPRPWTEALLACAPGGDWIEQRRERSLVRARQFSWERTARLTREVYIEAQRRFHGWGGPPGPQPAPRPAFLRPEADEGLGRGPGGPPHP